MQKYQILGSDQILIWSSVDPLWWDRALGLVALNMQAPEITPPPPLLMELSTSCLQICLCLYEWFWHIKERTQIQFSHICIIQVEIGKINWLIDTYINRRFGHISWNIDLSMFNFGNYAFSKKHPFQVPGLATTYRRILSYHGFSLKVKICCDMYENKMQWMSIRCLGVGQLAFWL